jgi:hypothetical protein
MRKPAPGFARKSGSMLLESIVFVILDRSSRAGPTRPFIKARFGKPASAATKRPIKAAHEDRISDFPIWKSARWGYDPNQSIP